MKIKVGVVGATGLVGEEFLKLLDQRNFPFSELRLFASDRSAGQKLMCGGKSYTLSSLSAGCFDGLNLVFFSSGDAISKEWAPIAVSAGAIAIDNSAAFRLEQGTPLVVPEVNGHRLPGKGQAGIIANPNCSTIQLVMAMKPLADQFGIESVHVASYQAVSGAGRPAKEELLTQTQSRMRGEEAAKPEQFPHPIAFNVIPQIGGFNDQGFSSEEWKVIHETKKILELPDLRVSAFTVRVPVLNGHSEAVWLRLKNVVERPAILKALSTFPGLQLLDESSQSLYPMALNASGRDEVFVGRVHRDLDDPQCWLLWVVADNLRKGAALNGIQIAERLF